MKKTLRLLLASWLVVSGSIGSPTPCAANTAVKLNQDFTTQRYTIRLSDLFEGVPAGIDRDIAMAPQPCKPAVYTDIVLNKLAETYRLDWQTQSNSDHIVVTSACTRISADMIRDAVIAKLNTDPTVKKGTFEIAFDTRNLEVVLPADQKADFTLENFSYDNGSKQFRADLSALSARGQHTTQITGRVTVKRNVPVLAHRMEAGATIGAADLDWVLTPEERITADVVTEPKQLIGREMRRDTPEGEVLRSRDVMPQRLVQRGSLVTLRIQTPYITITSQGKAQQDGAEGETIRVINTQSNRLVEGIVTSPGVVEIRTTRKLASAE